MASYIVSELRVGITDVPKASARGGSRFLQESEIPWIKLGHEDYARIILPDPVRGGLWLGFRQGGVAYYQDHSVRLSYGREQGFGEGQVSGLKLDDDGSIWRRISFAVDDSYRLQTGLAAYLLCQMGGSR